MKNIYLRTSTGTVSQAVLAVTVFYLDYCGIPLDVIDVSADNGLPWDDITDDTRVYLVGLTPSAQDFSRLLDQAGDVVWIDNDPVAVNTIESLSNQQHDYRRLKALRAGGKSLMELSWQSYFAWMKNPPEVVDLISRYDMHDTSAPGWDDRIVPFNQGLAARNIDPTNPEVFSSFWKEILCIRRDPQHEQQIIDEVIADGKAQTQQA